MQGLLISLPATVGPSVMAHSEVVRPGSFTVARRPVRVNALMTQPAAPHTARTAEVQAPPPVEPTLPRGVRLQDGVAAYVATGTRSLAGQVWNALPFWRAQQGENGAPAGVMDGDFVREVAQRAAEVDAEKRRERTKEKKPPADIRRFLKPTGLMETRYIRMLSALCADTYMISKLSSDTLFRKHRVHLITTSLACERSITSPVMTAAEAMEEGDGMAASLRDVQEMHRRLAGEELDVEVAPAKVELKKEKTTSPTEMLGSSLAAAAAAAASAAAPLASALPIQVVGSQLQSAAAAGHSTAVATVATVAAAMQSSWGDKNKKVSKDACLTSPTAWFVVDDPVTCTRFFVIQGSDNFDHWRLNLTFDPVTFEDPELGVKVHRGVYEAAQIMYHRFLPMVLEHVNASPFAKVVFTGHSLGGSLGTMLMLMYVRRGVIPASALNPTYTFGAPAIFCEGASGCGPCSAPASADSCPADLDGGGASLLERLGLPSGAIRNVIMGRDIVPRAFACDYAAVADVLARVSDGFRDHVCLQNSSRQVMYYFLGKVLVLQPDQQLKFVQEPGHPMLPEGPGLYTLREPTLVEPAVNPAPDEVRERATSMSATHMGNITPASGLTKREFKGKGDMVQLGEPAASLTDAIMELLNNPHPLDTLSETATYGPDGSISRYHNPDNYTKAVAAIMRARTKPWRQLLAEQRAANARHVASPRWYLPWTDGPRRLAAAFLRRNTAAALAGAAGVQSHGPASQGKDTPASSAAN